MRFPVIAAALIVLLSACARPVSQGQQASPSPTPSSAPSASATPTHVPVATGQVQVSPVPTASTGALPSGSLPPATPPPASVAPGATLAPGAAVVTHATPPPSEVAAAENAPPQIVDLQLDKTVVRGGDVVSGMVRTSLNTASVEARIGGYGISVPKVGAGRFALRYTVPNLPFFLKRTYDMVVIARNTAGVKAEKVVPISIR